MHTTSLLKTAGLTAALALIPAAAPAATLTSDGTTVRYAAAPGEANNVTLSVDSAGRLKVTANEPVTASGSCSYDNDFSDGTCSGTYTSIVVDLGDGVDYLSAIDLTEGHIKDGALHAELGPGDDVFKGSSAAEAVNGGDGTDELDARAGNDTIDGGAGDDRLEGDEGGDTVLGGDGEDRLEGDPSNKPANAADVIDGGAGFDTLDDYYPPDGSNAQVAPLVRVTLDGAANDGIAAEGDNIAGVERFAFERTAVFTGDDADNVVTVPEPASASTLNGMGGKDDLTGSNNNDQLDGGSGDDRLVGGFGDDTITGGPGRDFIDGDRPGRCNEVHCDIYAGPGNDTINAVDGEVDSITCGLGTDTANVDADDVVSPDCETVNRKAAPGPEPKPGPKPVEPTVKRKLTVTVAAPRLRAALAHGIKVRLSGLTAKRVVLRARRAGVVVASGTCAVKGGGCTVTLRFTAAAKKRLKRVHALKLTISGPGVIKALSLKR